jgi:hypothetical protein
VRDDAVRVVRVRNSVVCVVCVCLRGAVWRTQSHVVIVVCRTTVAAVIVIVIVIAVVIAAVVVISKVVVVT